MSEIQALGTIDKALTELKDDQSAINRVLQFVIDKFGDGSIKLGKGKGKGSLDLPLDENKEGEEPRLESNEIPGIAMITDGGEFRLTVRDPKAKNTNDAAIRLALVAIYTYCRLSGEKSASSKRIVKPILEHWRAYTGNTRTALANHPGIIREGDTLALDHHATIEAEKFMHDIKDPNLVGSWQPNGKKSRATKVKVND